MRLAKALDDAGVSVSRRLDRQLEVVDAVYDDQLWQILDALGLLKKLDDGELVCHVSGVKLTRDNIGGLVGTPDGPQPIADTVCLPG